MIFRKNRTLKNKKVAKHLSHNLLHDRAKLDEQRLNSWRQPNTTKKQAVKEKVSHKLCLTRKIIQRNVSMTDEGNYKFQSVKTSHNLIRVHYRDRTDNFTRAHNARSPTKLAI